MLLTPGPQSLSFQKLHQLSILIIEFTDTLALILPIGLSNNPEPTIGLAYTEKKKLINWVAL